jgi:hypothetical protein
VTEVDICRFAVVRGGEVDGGDGTMILSVLSACARTAVGGVGERGDGSVGLDCRDRVGVVVDAQHLGAKYQPALSPWAAAC